MYLLYFALWLIYVGSVTLETILFGVVIAAAIFAFTCRFMGYSLKKEIALYKKIPAMLYYIYILILEIMKANMTVIHMILSEEEELEPVLVSFHSDLKTQTGRAFMANAITLTPGTITVSLEDSDYVVHCLDESLAEGIDTSVIAQLLTKMENS
ncbi:MAG: Na+/H+ antiporter subunit E [Lachnospiraceae bacterium]|nr:Na+/H+ antiporter subunit E [Lachnospiraceae bacterium]